MRWDNLTRSGQDALFGADEVVARSIDTPEFRGMTFYEVRARSIINKVPDASRVPFGWTVNPYRGCSHACRYCLAGDTPILLADGRSLPLARLRVGDAIYGTVRDGAFRRYTCTEVLAHWQTVKPAYRVTLADGTELVSSGDHRFLTDCGWRYVAGRRPQLAPGIELLGTGQFAAPPEDSTDYRRGYLCGLIRDAPYLGPGLAPADLEALRRAHRYLGDARVRPREVGRRGSGAGGSGAGEVGVRGAGGARRAAGGRPSAGLDAITGSICWPGRPSDAWRKGFLAGIFDAQGSCTGGILRIADTDPEIIESVLSCLARFGFTGIGEGGAEPGDLRSVRLLGGLGEQLRFFQTVDPAISRKQSVAGRAIDSRLAVVSIEDLGLELPMYDITTGTGDFIAGGVVSHNCFARRTHEYLDLDSGRDFDSKIVVKVNAPELLRRELAAPRWAGEAIAMGTNVDPYQRAEGRYRLMPGVLAALGEARNPFSILTKGTLVLRDLDLLRAAAQLTEVSVNVSVGFVDEALWREVEPGAPAPRARLGVCRTLTESGIGCGVLMAPILPYLTDSPGQLDATVRAIAQAGARSITPIVLHLRPGAREWYFGWLQRAHPDLVPRYRELYAHGAYAPPAYQRGIAARVTALAQRYGVGSAPPGGRG